MVEPLIEPSGALCCTDCWPAVQSTVASLPTKLAYDIEEVVRTAYRFAGGTPGSYRSWRNAYGSSQDCRQWFLAKFLAEWQRAYLHVTGTSWPT